MNKITTILCIALLSIAICDMSYCQTASVREELSVPKLNFDEKGELIITASASSSKNDFDFLVGPHKVHHKILKARLAGSTEWREFDGTHDLQIILNGIGNMERVKMTDARDKPIEGMGLRLFNPATRLWSIYWTDSNSGVLGLPPEVGYFENKVGYFFSKGIYQGKNLITVYRWDARDSDNPVWSQALSEDNGQTWEWNWYMYMSRVGSSRILKENKMTDATDHSENINVLEVRNYLLQPNFADRFSNYFDAHFVAPMNELGGYTTGQFKIEGVNDRFVWFRGFTDMRTRVKFLNDFYFGSPAWKKFGKGANEMMINSSNVYLLRPLDKAVTVNSLKTNKAITVVDFYVCNSSLGEVINLFEVTYIPFLKTLGIEDNTLWVSELMENDFPQLSVFQDKNLLVSITNYSDKKEYEAKQRQIDGMPADLRKSMQGLITTHNNLVLLNQSR